MVSYHSSVSTANLSLNLRMTESSLDLDTFFLCQTYSPSSQASQQESDSQGHLWSSGLHYENHILFEKYLFTYLFLGTFQLPSAFLIDLSFSPSTTEADGPCGSPDSPRTQRWDDCSHPTGSGAPPQPGSTGVQPCHTTSDSRPWYVSKKWNK